MAMPEHGPPPSRELSALRLELQERPLAIGHATWEVFEDLLRQPLVPRGVIRREVETYMRELRKRGEEDPFLDLTLAVDVGEATLRMLDAVGVAAPPHHRLLVQAAARYYVLEEDSSSDTGSVLGFDDDAEVVRAALLHLGLAHLAEGL